MQAAVEAAPVDVVHHLPVVVALVVLAAREVGEEAARVVMGAGLGAELRPQRHVDQLGVAQVAEEEGAQIEALLVGERASAEQRRALGVGPPFDVLAAHEVENGHLRLLGGHEAQRGMGNPACSEDGQRAAVRARAAGMRARRARVRRAGTQRAV